MNSRPPTITAFAVLYMVIGVVSTSYYFNDFKTIPATFLSIIGTFLMFLIGTLAVIAGFYMLRGKKWARLLAISWSIFQVLVSATRSPGGLIIQGAVVFLIGLMMFNKEANEWFNSIQIPVPEPPVPLPDLPAPPAEVPSSPPDTPSPPASL